METEAIRQVAVDLLECPPSIVRLVPGHQVKDPGYSSSAKVVSTHAFPQSPVDIVLES